MDHFGEFKGGIIEFLIQENGKDHGIFVLLIISLRILLRYY